MTRFEEERSKLMASLTAISDAARVHPSVRGGRNSGLVFHCLAPTNYPQLSSDSKLARQMVNKGLKQGIK